MSAEKTQKIIEKLSQDPAIYWPYFDINGNGYLSLAEVDKGIRDVMQLPELFALKPVIMRAFNVAKTALKPVTKHGDNYVSKAEFKYLLKYLKTYTIYWNVFNDMDTNNDGRISLEEFKKAVPALQARGIKITNAVQTFCSIDKNSGGFILFDEFCDWAYSQHLTIEQFEKIKLLQLYDKIKVIYEKLSVDPPKLWASFVTNNNKYLNFDSVHHGIKSVVPQLLPLKIVIKRAFHDAKTALKSVNPEGDKYVSKSEFKYLLKYLRNYSYYWYVFNQIDINHDLRLSLEEFTQAVPALEALGLTIPDAKKAFYEIDNDHNERITFDQFCSWARCQLPA